MLRSTDDNSITISWSPPVDDGGRSDTYYTVEYSDPDNVGVMLLADCGSTCLTDTQCTINNLQPATAYAINVISHNGVSDQDKNGGLGRICSETFETDIAREFYKIVYLYRMVCKLKCIEQPEWYCM